MDFIYNNSILINSIKKGINEAQTYFPSNNNHLDLYSLHPIHAASVIAIFYKTFSVLP